MPSGADRPARAVGQPEDDQRRDPEQREDRQSLRAHYEELLVAHRLHGLVDRIAGSPEADGLDRAADECDEPERYDSAEQCPAGLQRGFPECARVVHVGLEQVPDLRLGLTRADGIAQGRASREPCDSRRPADTGGACSPHETQNEEDQEEDGHDDECPANGVARADGCRYRRPLALWLPESERDGEHRRDPIGDREVAVDVRVKRAAQPGKRFGGGVDPAVRSAGAIPVTLERGRDPVHEAPAVAVRRRARLGVQRHQNRVLGPLNLAAADRAAEQLRARLALRARKRVEVLAEEDGGERTLRFAGLAGDDRLEGRCELVVLPRKVRQGDCLSRIGDLWPARVQAPIRAVRHERAAPDQALEVDVVRTDAHQNGVDLPLAGEPPKPLDLRAPRARAALGLDTAVGAEQAGGDRGARAGQVDERQRAVAVGGGNQPGGLLEAGDGAAMASSIQPAPAHRIALARCHRVAERDHEPVLELDVLLRDRLADVQFELVRGIDSPGRVERAAARAGGGAAVDPPLDRGLPVARHTGYPCDELDLAELTRRARGIERAVEHSVAVEIAAEAADEGDLDRELGLSGQCRRASRRKQRGSCDDDERDESSNRIPAALYGATIPE
jgi:hypothetical protein